MDSPGFKAKRATVIKAKRATVKITVNDVERTFFCMADDILSDFCLCSDSRLFVSSGLVPPLSLLVFDDKRLWDTSTVSLGLESFRDFLRDAASGLLFASSKAETMRSSF